MPVKNRFAELFSDITTWRRDFHRQPELMYDVQNTAATVARLLRSFGCDEVVEGIGKTGVVGVIKGQRDTSGRVIGLRADMDALPIIEKTGLDYASKVPGKMHACGHDGHMAMLLGAARYLTETRNFDGTVALIFQPAEEGGAGGQAMVLDGMMTRFGIDEVYGMHNMPGLPLGHFAICTGPIMAAADEFTITVTGKGGHAAMPHKCVDTALIAAHIIIAVQSIVARVVDPMDPAVVSISTIATDSPAHNVLPQVAVLKGTVRSMTPEVKTILQTRLNDITVGIAQAMGGSATLDYETGYPATVNSPAETAYAITAARAISDHVDENTAPQMGSEDFSYMLLERPGSYIFIGNGESADLHHPAYNFDDNALPFGCSWYAQIAEQRLPLSAQT